MSWQKTDEKLTGAGDSWSLEPVSDEAAPADRVDVGRPAVDPLVELGVPAVKVDPEQPTIHFGHGRDADQTWVDQVRGFDRHSRLEAVLHYSLKRESFESANNNTYS